MAEQSAQGVDAPRTSVDAGDSASGTAADTDSAKTSTKVDAKGEDDGWKARFEEARKDRDRFKEAAREFETFKGRLAEALGFAPVQGDEDPKVVIKQIRDELAQERKARVDLEKSLVRERVFRDVANPEAASIALAGLEATGAVDITSTDPAAIVEALRNGFPSLFQKEQSADSDDPPKPPAVKIPGPKNGKAQATFLDAVMRDGRRTL